MAPEPVAFGSWPSAIDASMVAGSSSSFGGPVADGADLWWSESRPAEGGRVQLVRAGDPPTDVLAEAFSARTRAHEYGGGAFGVSDGLVVFANDADQRLWALDTSRDEQGRGATGPWPITPEPARARADRYADLRIVTGPAGRVVLAAREHHLDKAADAPRGHRTHNDLVAVTVGAPGEPVGDPTVLWSAADFVSDPRPNPDGTALCWLQWDHPDMPWDRTEVWAARLVWDAGRPGLRDARRVAGGEAESIAQPAWSPRGVLHLVSDRDDGWWSLYRVADDGVDDAGVPPADAPLEPVVVVPEGELAQPRWVFGQSWYAWAPDGTLVACARHAGRDRLLAVPADGAGVPGVSSVRWIAEENTAVDGLVGTSAGVACIAASFTAGPGVVELRDPAGAAEVIVVRAPDDVGLDATWWSAPEHIDVPIDDGSVIHALVYPPVNPEVRAPEGALPPLLVQLHGGPTSAARPLWAPAVQYWTSRGWCVADVNYRGSTGYGRRYREALYGRWGEAEAADCIAVARWLVQAGRVDGRHLVIRGSSAGGFTALAALIESRRDGGPGFAAAALRYPVIELEALVADTHDFEAFSTDRLIGPYPEEAERYRQRSPLHRLDELDAPVIVSVGREDRVVPMAQAERLAQALAERSVPCELLVFDAEGHGFRRAETIERVLGAEGYVLARVLGFPSESGR